MVTLYAYVLISIIRLVAPKNKSKIELFLVGAVALLYPGLIFVDNGHFQYNHIALALFLFSTYCFHVQLAVFGSISFVLALNFKQMELYHSLPIFVYLFSRSIVKSQTHGIFERLSK
uniref:Alpha-1,3-glucosyltransferase n=1 Tax=Panagrolaimus sp. JU765 TaxID=591449 RepID=A0AC34R639_9BILA